MGNFFIYFFLFIILSVVFVMALPLLAFLLVIYGAVLLASLIA